MIGELEVNLLHIMRLADNKYIKNKFLELVYKNNIEAEEEIRKSKRSKWFKNTIMIFERL